MNAPLATIGHNSRSAAEVLKDDPSAVYASPALLDEAIAEFKAQLAAATIDTTTSKGRDEIKSRSAEFSRLKVAIENAGKALTEEWRKKTGEVNAVKSRVSTEFDSLRDAAREPLNKWEEHRKARDAEIAGSIAKIDQTAEIAAGTTAAQIKERIDWLNGLTISEETHEEHAIIASGKRKKALGVLEAALEREVQAEKDRAELAALRAAQAEREKKDAEEKAIRDAEAAEAARVEQERLAAERQKEQEAQRIKDAAEQARKDAEEKAEREKQAEIDRIRAEEAAKLKAAQDESSRLQKEAADRAAKEAAEKAAAEDRQRDIEHRGKIMREAKEAIMEHSGVKEDAAKKIVLAIIAGSIPHTIVKF